MVPFNLLLLELSLLPQLPDETSKNKICQTRWLQLTWLHFFIFESLEILFEFCFRLKTTSQAFQKLWCYPYHQWLTPTNLSWYSSIFVIWTSSTVLLSVPSTWVKRIFFQNKLLYFLPIFIAFRYFSFIQFKQPASWLRVPTCPWNICVTVILGLFKYFLDKAGQNALSHIFQDLRLQVNSWMGATHNTSQTHIQYIWAFRSGVLQTSRLF